MPSIHTIPDRISEEAGEALSHYPELEQIPIEFRFKKKIRKSFMQAQPFFPSLLRKREDRKYLIFISDKIEIEGQSFSIDEMDSRVLIGWLGHELGHIMDYQCHSNIGLMVFGMRYLFQQSFLKKAERTADRMAIQHGMYEYIMTTKNFILNHAQLSRKYKNRIRRLYMSPEEIVQMVNELDQQEIKEKLMEDG